MKALLFREPHLNNQVSKSYKSSKRIYNDLTGGFPMCFTM